MNDVLLAEDEPVSRQFLAEALRALGWHCSVFEDGDSALAAAVERRFDLLVLDVNLPRLDGFALLERLRDHGSACSLDAPALALTADLDPALRLRLLAHGFAEVGHKPITLDELARLTSALVHEATALPTWDEAAALRCAGGEAAIVATLRTLMRRELPLQRRRLVQAWELDDDDAARGELHRLRAACGFCGAARLAQTLDALHRTATRANRRAVIDAIDAILAAG